MFGASMRSFAENHYGVSCIAALLLALPLAPAAHADDGLDALQIDPSCTILCPGGDGTGWTGNGGDGAYGGHGGNAALFGDGGRGGTL